MKKCPECGHLDLDDANFCTLDGEELRFLQETTPELLREMEAQKEKEWEEWINELIGLQEDQFLSRIFDLFAGTKEEDHPTIGKFFSTLLGWRKDGPPLLDEELKLYEVQSLLITPGGRSMLLH